MKSRCRCRAAAAAIWRRNVVPMLPCLTTICGAMKSDTSHKLLSAQKGIGRTSLTNIECQKLLYMLHLVIKKISKIMITGQ